MLGWAAIALTVAVPLSLAAMSPLLQWREPIYVAAGFAGITALAILLIQPLLAANRLPGIGPRTSRRAHAWLGGALLVLIALHVAGLYVTSPPDVIDALSFASPTPFSLWGVIAMWAAVATGLVAAFRRRARLRPVRWRQVHVTLAVVILGGTVAHALLIDGTMETISKIALCAAAVIATARLIVDLRAKRRSRAG